MGLKEDVKNLPEGIDIWSATPEQRTVIVKQFFVLFFRMVFFGYLCWLVWRHWF